MLAGTRWIASVFTLMSLVFFSFSAQAFYTVMDSGQLVMPGQYRLGAEVQFVTEGDDGVNIGARMDGPINEEWNWKAELGFGTTDIYFGGYGKWVPIPDTESQPAIGLTFGAHYGHYERSSEIAIRAIPFVSKELGADFGLITPYFALPFGVRQVENDATWPIQAVIGSEFRANQWEHLTLVAELGFNVDKAFTYFSIGAQADFDPEVGFELP